MPRNQKETRTEKFEDWDHLDMPANQLQWCWDHYRRTLQSPKSVISWIRTDQSHEVSTRWCLPLLHSIDLHSQTPLHAATSFMSSFSWYFNIHAPWTHLVLFLMFLWVLTSWPLPVESRRTCRGFLPNLPMELARRMSCSVVLLIGTVPSGHASPESDHSWKLCVVSSSSGWPYPFGLSGGSCKP